MLGKVTRKKVCQPPAPRTMAASSSSAPCSCIKGISSRATKGEVMNAVASTIPGTAKMILMSWSSSQGPSQPCAPNNRTKIIPEITGETANGRSIRVVRTFFPGKSKRAMHQAAATPNTALIGTATAAMSSVSLAALSASGSVTAAQYAARPLDRA